MALGAIFRRRNRERGSGKNRGRRGITLVEILVVLAIMGLALSLASSSFGAGSQAESVRATNQLAATMRFAFDKARTSGTHMRIHIDLKRRTFTLQAADEAMYLPATNRDGEVVVVTEEDLKDRERRDQQAQERYNASIVSNTLDKARGPDDPAAASAPAGEDESIDFDPYAAQARTVPRQRPPLFGSFENEGGLKDLGTVVELPDDVKIIYVRTDVDPEPIVEGEASLYFFPGGRTQLARIQIQDQNDEEGFTIEIQPLTGKVTILEGLQPLELPDDFLGAKDDRGKQRQRRSF